MYSIMWAAIFYMYEARNAITAWSTSMCVEYILPCVHMCKSYFSLWNEHDINTTRGRSVQAS